MKCEKCGKEISYIITSEFLSDGSDCEDTISLKEDKIFNAVTMETDRDWTGYGLTEEEIRDRIGCPYCKQFPFESEEIHVSDVVRIICFKKDHETETGDSE